MTDEQGRVFRIGFDPGSRLLLGVGYAPYVQSAADGEGQAATGEAGAHADTGLVEVGVLYRHRLEFPADGVSWKLYHQFAVHRWRFDGTADWLLDGALYQGRYMRWSRDGQLVLPSNPPRRLSFPLNIGFETVVGEVGAAKAGSNRGGEIGVMRAEVLLDPWRQQELGSFAQFGLGPAYDIWLHDAPSGPLVHHLVAPFTRLSFTVHHESADGHHAVEAQLVGAGVLSSEHGWAWRAQSHVGYEAILLGINDWPLSAFASCHYRLEQLPRPVGGAHEFAVATGVRLGIPLTH